MDANEGLSDEVELPLHVVFASFIITKYKFGTNFKFFKDKDFRYYDKTRGLWEKKTRKEVLKMIAITALEQAGSTYGRSFNNVAFFKNFMNWLMILCEEDVPEVGVGLLAFSNCVLDLKNMTVTSHDRNLYVMQGFQANFAFTPPSKTTIQFIWQLGSFDPVKINILRVILKLVIMGGRRFDANQSAFDVIFYLWGRAGSGKSTLFKLIKLLAYSNCSDMTLEGLKQQFGRANLIGASIHLFNDVNYSSLSMGQVSDLKKLASKEPISVDIKNSQPVEVQGGLVIMSGNELFTSQDKINLDQGWVRRYLPVPVELPLKKLSKDLNLEDKLKDDIGGLICWAMAIPDAAVEVICNGAAKIAQHLNTTSENQDFSAIVKQWVLDNLRILPNNKIIAGFNADPKPGTLGYAFGKWAQENKVVVPNNRNAFKTGFLRSIEELSLPNVGGKANGPKGWYIIGLVISKVKGEAIPSPMIREIQVLSQVPVFEYLAKGGQAKSFIYRGLSKNEEIRDLDDLTLTI